MTLCKEALTRFQELFSRATRETLNEPTVMSLATVSPEGFPSLRHVLLKRADEQGFTFFTNLNSRKALQLEKNPHGALAFFWDPLMEQVTVEGLVEALPTIEADEYWATRSRRSQIGAWSSRQSHVMPTRAHLLMKVAKVSARFGLGKIPRPDFWSGFRLVPHRIEFWKAGNNRLNWRTLYRLEDGKWVKEMLYP